MTAPTTQLSKQLEQLSDPKLRDWLRTQPLSVVAVVDLALVEDNETIVAGLFPAYAATFDEMAGALTALDDEATGTYSDREWLAKWGQPAGNVAPLDARNAVEIACEHHRSAVQVGAQLVASLMTLRGAA